MTLEDSYGFIQYVVSEDVEEKLWQLYLSIPFKEKTFEEFKTETQSGQLTHAQVELSNRNNSAELSHELNLVFSMLGGVVDGD